MLSNIIDIRMQYINHAIEVHLPSDLCTSKVILHIFSITQLIASAQILNQWYNCGTLFLVTHKITNTSIIYVQGLVHLTVINKLQQYF